MVEQIDHPEDRLTQTGSARLSWPFSKTLGSGKAICEDEVALVVEFTKRAKRSYIAVWNPVRIIVAFTILNVHVFLKHDCDTNNFDKDLFHLCTTTKCHIDSKCSAKTASSVHRTAHC